MTDIKEKLMSRALLVIERRCRLDPPVNPWWVSTRWHNMRQWEAPRRLRMIIQVGFISEGDR